MLETYNRTVYSIENQPRREMRYNDMDVAFDALDRNSYQNNWRQPWSLHCPLRL